MSYPDRDFSNNAPGVLNILFNTGDVAEISIYGQTVQSAVLEHALGNTESPITPGRVALNDVPNPIYANKDVTIDSVYGWLSLLGGVALVPRPQSA